MLGFRNMFAIYSKDRMRTALLIVCIGLTPSTAGAETELGLSVKGGFDAARLSNDFYTNRYGFSGGFAGYLDWSLTDQFWLAGQLELLYVPRGAEVVVDDMLQGKVRQHYFDIIVAAHPRVRLGPVSIYLMLGGGVNLLIGANDENASGVPRDITDDLHRVDVALLVGAGVAMHIPRRRLGPFGLDAVFLEVRHDRGLIDIDTMDIGLGNRTSSLMLGVSLVVGSGTADGKSTSVPVGSDPPPPPEAAVPAE